MSLLTSNILSSLLSKIKTQLDAKLDKTGGTISGDLKVENSINVCNSISPVEANACNLGSASKPFNNTYTKNFEVYGYTTGNVVPKINHKYTIGDKSYYWKQSYVDSYRGGVIKTNPETDHSVTIPYLFNDLAFLHKRGGSTNMYITTDTDYTQVDLVQEDIPTCRNVDFLYNGRFSSTNITLNSTSDIVVVDIVLPTDISSKTTYDNKIWIDFTGYYYSFNTVKVYTMNSSRNSVYTLKGTMEDSANSLSEYGFDVEGGDYGFDRIRLVMINAYNKNCRISEIGLTNYKSDGGFNFFISRNGDKNIFGDLAPNATGTYNLGSESNHWGTVYADNFVDETGNIKERIDTKADQSDLYNYVPLVGWSTTEAGATESKPYIEGYASISEIAQDVAYCVSGNIYFPSRPYSNYYVGINEIAEDAYVAGRLVYADYHEHCSAIPQNYYAGFSEFCEDTYNSNTIEILNGGSASTTDWGSYK